MQLKVIQKRIYEIRGQKVMLDFDLAELYDTETKRLKEAVRRNIDRFPSDFMFELTIAEYENLRTQFATSSWTVGFTWFCLGLHASCSARLRRSAVNQRSRPYAGQ